MVSGVISMRGRLKLIKPYIGNKDVLDIGCCNFCYFSGIEKMHYNLHDNLKNYCKTLKGIDISEEGVKFLREKGYNVEVGNAENFNLNQKFDVIIAGELIEHLSNFQGFFDSVKRHLKENGLLILTTPNMFYFKEILFLILRGYPAINPEHTCWFDEIALRQLLNRFSFSIEKIMYTTEISYAKKKFAFKSVILRLIEKLIPAKKLKYGTIIVIAKKQKV